MIPMTEDGHVVIGVPPAVTFGSFSAIVRGHNPNTQIRCARCGAIRLLGRARAFPTYFMYEGNEVYDVRFFCDYVCILAFLDDRETGHA